MDDWLYSDKPLLVFHVVSFQDATLVNITWLHVVMDAMGLSSFVNALSLELSGEGDKIPPFQGFDKDPLGSLGETPACNKYVLYDMMFSTMQQLIFAFWLVIELMWHRKESQRLICLPKSYFQELRETALRELKEKQDGDAFVSESDVLLAWWVRLMLLVIQPSRNRKIAIMNVFDIRSLLEPDMLRPPSKSYVGNATQVCMSYFTAQQLLDEPLSSTAKSFRTNLETQRSREQLDAVTYLQKPAIVKSGYPPMFGDPGQLLIVCSNWNKAKLFDVDFSGALLEPMARRAPSENRIGTPSYIHVAGHNNGFFLRNCGPVIGKDAWGNWWLTWHMRASVWPKIEQELKEMSQKS